MGQGKLLISKDVYQKRKERKVKVSLKVIFVYCAIPHRGIKHSASVFRDKKLLVCRDEETHS